jgi:hypothetical protein
MLHATLVTSPKERIVNILPMRRESGVPGVCGTSSLYDEAINSEQSQRLAVGSKVIRYVKNEIRNVSNPKICFHRFTVNSVVGK